jgi:hypothetical protein
LLEAVARGDDTETRALSIRLASEIIADPLVSLAHQVLAGGPHATANAIELAGRLLAGEKERTSELRPASGV